MNVYIYEEFILDKVREDALTGLGYNIKYFPKNGIDNVDDVDIYVGYPSEYLSKELLPNIKYIQLCSSGFDNIDISGYRSRGVSIANARGVHSIPISEYVLMYILTVYKQYDLLKQRQDNCEWNKDFSIVTLEKMRVLVLGTGSIGQEIAKRCKSFNMEIIGYNSNGRSIDYFDYCVSNENLSTELGNVDVVVNALPLNDNTRYLVNEEFVDSLKEGILFINIGRGQTVDTNALIKSADKFNKIVLDVFEEEPLPIESELWKHPRFVVTPHSSFYSNKTKEKIWDLAYNNLVAYHEGKEILNLL